MKKSRWSSWMNSITSLKNKVGGISAHQKKPRILKSRGLRLEPLEQRQMLSITVNSWASGDDGLSTTTLYEAIQAVNQGADDEIEFAASMFGQGSDTITLQGSELQILEDLEINGPAGHPEWLKIDAGNSSGVFSVGTGVTAIFSNMTITGGYAAEGGGIYGSATSNITLTDMVIDNNASTVFGGGVYSEGASLGIYGTDFTGNQSVRGGGLYATGVSDIIITDSSFTENTVSHHGAGAYFTSSAVSIEGTIFSGNQANGAGSLGGGIIATTSATLEISNSSLVGNSATVSGGAIYSAGYSGWASTIEIVNSTITSNTSGTGGGIYNLDNTDSDLSISNSIVALNTATTSAPDICGPVTKATSFNNLIGNGSGQTELTDDSNGNQVGVAPGFINAIEGNYRLSPASLAVNAGSNAKASDMDYDLDGNDRIIYGTVDIGAYEYLPTMYWDTNGDTIGFGDGSGTWSASDACWTTDPTGASTTQIWDNSEDYVAVFTDGLGGTVTISGAVSAQSLQFLGSGYIIVGGSLELTEDIHSIYVAENEEATISATITGSDGLLKTGDGTLILSGTLSLSGGLTANYGKAVLVTSAPYTSWTENGGKVMGPGALDFDDLGTGHLYPTVVSCFADGWGISRADMLSIFDVADGGYVTSDELHDLRLIVDIAPDNNNDSPYRLQMDGYVSESDPGYVASLAGYVVDGINDANDYYQGSALGDLAANDPGTKLTTLVNKWFKGLDHPDTTYGYEQATGSLFVNGTSVDDMHQGIAGDCYLIAALGSIADADIDTNANNIADAIEDMIVDNGDGTWTVRFYDDSWNSLTANYVTVDNKLPVDASDLLVYANYGLSLSSELWVPLLEKAYAQWNETGNALRSNINGTNLDGLNSYVGINGGHTFVAKGQVLGEYASGYYMAAGQTTLNNAISDGYAVTIATLSEYDSGLWQDGLREGHAYVITSYKNGYYTLRNPWGSSDPGLLTWKQLNNDCVYYAFADSSGTTPFDTPPVGAGAPSGSIMPSDTMAAVYAALSASQTAGKSDHDGLAMRATKSSLSDLATFQYDRVDAALAADLSGRGNDGALDHVDAIWSTDSDRLNRNSVSDAVDMLFSDMEASLIGKILPDWDIDLPGAA